MLNYLRIKLRLLGKWLLENVKPSQDDIDLAIKQAFSEVGLPLEDYSLEFDLLHSGKLSNVLIHSSNILGNPLITVGDLKKLLA